MKPLPRSLLAVVGAVLLCSCGDEQPANLAGTPDGGNPGGAPPAAPSMVTARWRHTATLLLSEKVLLAGGVGSLDALASAELYDPLATTLEATGLFMATGSLATARFGHTATLLPSGKVLIAGGTGISYSSARSSAELYDPVEGTFTPTGSMATARWFHTATLLPSGKVLIAGGWESDGFEGTPFASAELYDPVAGTFTSTGSMTTARQGHTATLLPSGKVLIVGGWPNSLPSAELYDPVAATFTPTGSMTTGRQGHTATLLPSGKVLIAGGWEGVGNPFASAELYDPLTGMFTPAGSMTTGRSDHTATLLPSGKVLIAGGFEPLAALASAELYDPVATTFTATGSMTTGRFEHTATLLPNGDVLVAGGSGASGPLASAERLGPCLGCWDY